MSAKLTLTKLESLLFKACDTWKADYKYHYAETGFTQGECNPVPLARLFTTSMRNLGHSSKQDLSFSKRASGTKQYRLNMLILLMG